MSDELEHLRDLLNGGGAALAMLEAHALPAGWREAVEEAQAGQTPERVAERAATQHRRKEYHTALRSGDIGAIATVGQPLFHRGVHLPDGATIASVYVANRSTQRVNVFIGHGTQNNAITLAQVATMTFCVSPVPDDITSLQIVPAAAGTGLVVVMVSTLPWSPQNGALT